MKLCKVISIIMKTDILEIYFHNGILGKKTKFYVQW
jgi:hypothetical protein